MYERQSWFWEFYPPPYNAIASKPFPPKGAVGLGCAGDIACGPCAAKQQQSAGMGDAGTFVTNLTSGNWSDALFGSDFFTGVPNVVVVLAAWWVFSKVTQDLGKAKKKVRGYSATRKKRARLKAELDAA